MLWRSGGRENISHVGGHCGNPCTKYRQMLTDEISSLVIDGLCDGVVDQKIAVACFYCDFQSQKMQTPENVLGALVKQIARGLGAIPPEINAVFQKAKGQVGGRGLRVPEALELLKAVLSRLDQAFICIDALDELQGRHLSKLLRSLHAVSESFPGIRFFFTGRPHIGVEIEKYFPGGAWFLRMKPMKEDITKYVETMLDDDSDPEAMNPDLRAEIMNRISETISDVYVIAIFYPSLLSSLTVAPRFLLVSLNITAILNETTIFQRREQLNRMTNGRDLGDAYGVTLDRIVAQSGGRSRLGMAALMWVSRSERPMTPDELCHALGVRIGSTHPHPDNIPSIQTLLSSCLGLVTFDKEGSTLRLVHFTLQEYLNSRSEIFQNADAVMAEVCLTYLNFDCVRKLPPTLEFAPGGDPYFHYLSPCDSREPSPELVSAHPKYPFLKYASNYWGCYARNGTTEGVRSLALRLLDKFDSHISSKFLLIPHVYELYLGMQESAQGFTGLHCVAYLGINEIAEALLEMKDWEVDKTDFEGCTPLIWASKNGCEGVIRLLLERVGANINATDTTYGQTPLSWAVQHGREGAVRVLLARNEVNPELRDNDGRTPFSHAAGRGSERILKLLLEWEEVNPESRDNNSRTPLSYAAIGGSEEVVKLLLKRGEVNPESRDKYDRTPLSYAAECGSVEAVRLLLEREEVNPESRDNQGRTPLSYAARGRSGGVLKLLLEREEVNPESRDGGGQTPLSHAAQGGSQEVLGLLLQREEVHPELPDNFGLTPLSLAALYGNEDAAKLLLERSEVNPDIRDNSGRTPLSYAAESSGGVMLGLLLERQEVNPESRDNQGRTPLSWAAHNRVNSVKDVVKLLLERDEVNPESRDNSGRTPLSYAAGCNSGEEAVKLLLEREEVNPESRDNKGRTPLSHAAEFWGEGAVKLLLERADVNPDSRDYYGLTPFAWAEQHLGLESLKIRLLLNEKTLTRNREKISAEHHTPWLPRRGGDSEAASRMTAG